MFVSVKVFGFRFSFRFGSRFGLRSEFVQSWFSFWAKVASRSPRLAIAFGRIRASKRLKLASVSVLSLLPFDLSAKEELNAENVQNDCPSERLGPI